MLEEHFDLTPERVKERLASVDTVLRWVGLEFSNIFEKLQTVSSSFDMAFFSCSRFPRIFQQVSGGQPIHTAQQLMEGLSRIGVTCTDLAPLSSAFQLVTHRPGGHTGTQKRIEILKVWQRGWMVNLK